MAADDEFKVGDVLAGRYRVKRLLGRGGMGVVLAATDPQLHRNVAIKLLLPSLVQDVEALARFRREARAAVVLTSEHAVRVHDVGELPNGTPFMVMELLSGQDLDEVIRERQRFPTAEAVGCILQAAEAIAEAHAHGIVHRDLKPRNVFLTRRADGTPLVKVLDFGLAKAPLQKGERGITSAYAVMGSPEYMSPEQMRGTRDVDARSDIWALGVTLYELVTGECPFTAPSTPELFVKVLKEEPRPPHEVFAEVPFGLSRVILRCLKKEPAARYQTVAELAEALEEFAPLDAHGAAGRVERVLNTVRPPPSLASEPPAPLSGYAGSEGETRPIEPEGAEGRGVRAETVTAATFDSSPRRARARRRVYGGAIGAGTAVVVGLAVWLYATSAARPPAPAEQSLAVPEPSAVAPAVAAPPASPEASPSTSASSGSTDVAVDAGSRRVPVRPRSGPSLPGASKSRHDASADPGATY